MFGKGNQKTQIGDLLFFDTKKFKVRIFLGDPVSQIHFVGGVKIFDIVDKGIYAGNCFGIRRINITVDYPFLKEDCVQLLAEFAVFGSVPAVFNFTVTKVHNMNQGYELFFVRNISVFVPLFAAEIFKKENNRFPVISEIFKTVERKGL